MKVQWLMVVSHAADDTEPAVAADTEAHTEVESVLSMSAAGDMAAHVEVALDDIMAAAAADYDRILDVAAAMTTAAVHLDVTPFAAAVLAATSRTVCRQAAVYHTVVLAGQHEVPDAQHTGLISALHSAAQHTTDVAVLVAELADTKAVQLVAD